MPSWVPYPLPMIYFTGLAEIVGGLAILLPRFRRAAAYGLVILLVVVFPANVKMALDHPHPLLWARLPVQGLLIWWILWCTRARQIVVS